MADHLLSDGPEQTSSPSCGLTAHSARSKFACFLLLPITIFKLFTHRLITTFTQIDLPHSRAPDCGD